MSDDFDGIPIKPSLMGFIGKNEFVALGEPKDTPARHTSKSRLSSGCPSKLSVTNQWVAEVEARKLPREIGFNLVQGSIMIAWVAAKKNRIKNNKAWHNLALKQLVSTASEHGIDIEKRRADLGGLLNRTQQNEKAAFRKKGADFIDERRQVYIILERDYGTRIANRYLEALPRVAFESCWGESLSSPALTKVLQLIDRELVRSTPKQFAAKYGPIFREQVLIAKEQYR
jgi:hypothetical protein